MLHSLGYLCHTQRNTLKRYHKNNLQQFKQKLKTLRKNTAASFFASSKCSVKLVVYNFAPSKVVDACCECVCFVLISCVAIYTFNLYPEFKEHVKY